MGCCTSSKPAKEETSSKKNLTEMSPGVFVNVSERNVLSEYRMVKVLGEGSYGKVSEAINLTSGIKRAIKTIPLSSASVGPNTIMDEVEIMKTLDHPNIIRVLEGFQEPNHFHIVMELCTGGELFDRIASEKHFSELRASQYMSDLIAALGYLHNIGLVHRDLKPENLIFEDESPTAHLKLADFGGATWFSPHSTLRLAFGSSYYMAPEVLKKNYNEKCDVWSAGVIMFMMLGGYPPYNGDTDEEIFRSIRKGKLKFSHPLWEKISSQAKDLIKLMLTRDPLKRPSISEIAEHPWLNQRKSKKSEHFLNRLAHFNMQSKLQRATLAYVANHLIDQKEMIKISETFNEIDENKDGHINLKELEKGFKQYGICSDIDASELIKQIDSDGNGYVDYSEFLVAAINWKKKLSKKRLRQAFRKYDLDGDGHISLVELRNVFGEANENFFVHLISEADVNGDGLIDFDEFADLMLRKYTPDNRV